MTKNDVQSYLESLCKEQDSIAVFIDGVTANALCKAIELDIDWKKFSDKFRYLSRVKRMNFYMSTVLRNEDAKDWKPLFDWLNHNGFYVKTLDSYYCMRNSEVYSNNVSENETIRTGRTQSVLVNHIEYHMTLDALEIIDKLDHLILFSSNENLVPLLERLRNRGVVTSVIANSAKELRRYQHDATVKDTPNRLFTASDNFIDLEMLRTLVSREKESK